jgi:iron complex outermembrane receptor protein
MAGLPGVSWAVEPRPDASVSADGAVTSVTAQSQPEAQDAAVQQGTAAEGEILVTAQRRSERAIEVPMSVTSLSGVALEAANIVDTGDLPRVAPGLNFVNSGGYTAITLRGIGSFQRSPGAANNVAIYFDGAYFPSKVAGIFDLPDISNIEVLRGPQGTLYGINATAGAILINTLDPSFTTKMKFTVGYGSLNNVYARFFVTTPLVDDRLAVSLAGSYEDRGAYLTNVLTGRKQGGVNSAVLRGKLLFTPSDTTQFILAASYNRRRTKNRRLPASLPAAPQDQMLSCSIRTR